MSDMNVKEAKELWALIQSRWQELPDGERGEGSKRKIGYAMWLETDLKTPFDTWFKGIVNMAKISSNGHSQHHDSEPINRRYESLAMRHDTLPSDVLLSEMWNCSTNGTISSIRARMKKRGFGFAELPDGQWRVTARPAAQLTLPTQDQATEHNDSALRQDIARQNILIAEAVDRLEARINELAQINAEILQVMREVWQP